MSPLVSDYQRNVRQAVRTDGIKAFSQRGFPTFETRERALEFLVED